MRNTLKLVDGKYTLNSLGPWPRTTMQVAFWEALWRTPDRRFPGLGKTASAVGHTIVDRCLITR